MQHMTHICEICRRKAPLTYRKDRDEYICDSCWDELPAQSTDDGSEEVDANNQ